MGTFKVTFYESDGRLIRFLEIAGMIFWEQFDCDGWYGYYGGAFTKIDEEKAIDMALREIQVKHPDYINRSRAKFKLYDFYLEQLHYGRKAKAA
jgi:hypothetical protein